MSKFLTYNWLVTPKFPTNQDVMGKIHGARLQDWLPYQSLFNPMFLPYGPQGMALKG
jgi:hypothetical protein